MSADEARWTPELEDQSDDALPPNFYVGLASEVSSGDTRRALAAIRNRLAQELDIAEGKDVAPIANALLKTIDAIDKVPDLAAADPVNEIAARRERRRREAGLGQTG